MAWLADQLTDHINESCVVIQCEKTSFCVQKEVFYFLYVN